MDLENRELFERAEEFENKKHVFRNTSDRIRASKEAKKLILSLNEIYKVNKDSEIMDRMKRLSAIKQKAEKRLNMRITI